MLARAERDTTVVLLDRPRYFTNAAEYAPDYTVLSDNCTRWWPTSAWWRRTADCSTPVTWLGWRRRSSSLRARHSGHIGLVHRAGGSGCTAHKLLSARIDGKRNGNKRSADRLRLRAERCYCCRCAANRLRVIGADSVYLRAINAAARKTAAAAKINDLRCTATISISCETKYGRAKRVRILFVRVMVDRWKKLRKKLAYHFSLSRVDNAILSTLSFIDNREVGSQNRLGK